MRNKYPGKCYKCGERVGKGAGFFERCAYGWRVQHVGCRDKPLEGERVIDHIEPRKLEKKKPESLFS